MNRDVEYDIGSPVVCRDGPCGELRRVVVDPVANAITHLTVGAKHQTGAGHLVPVVLVASADGEIRLRCTTAEFRALEPAKEIQFVPGALGAWNYRQDQMLSLPYFALPGGGLGGGLGLGVAGIAADAGPHFSITDRVPAGEVEVRRGDHVKASDGEIGRVQGLAIDPADRHVTHVLLEEGHLWGKKRVAIPIGAVRRIGADVQVDLTKAEVRDLPSVDLDDGSSSHSRS